MRKSSDVFRPDSGYRVFLLSMITFGLSYGLYKGVLDNYLAEIVAMSSFDKGVSEFFRELPGLMLVFVLALLGIVVNYLSGIGYRKTADTNTPDAAALGLRVEPQKIYDKGGTVIYALGALGVYDFLGDECYEFDVDVENHSFFEKGFIARNVQVNGVAIPPEDEIFAAIVHGKASETYHTGDGLMLSVAGLARLNIAKIETITFQIEEPTSFFNNELGTAKLTEPMTIRVF